jgi:hypothetical protein
MPRESNREKGEIVMKNRLFNLAFLIAVAVLLTAALNAQIPIRQPLFRVDIPFAFMAGGAHLPAGHYHVYHPGDPYLIVLERDDGQARAMAYVHPSATKNGEAATKLVFNKYGDQYFLSQVWTEQDREVHQCFKCRLEHHLMAEASKPQVVVLAANR